MHSKFLLTSIFSLALLSNATSTAHPSTSPSHSSAGSAVEGAAKGEAQEGVGAYFISSSSEEKSKPVVGEYDPVSGEKKKGGEGYDGGEGYGDVGYRAAGGNYGEKGYGEKGYGAEKGNGGGYGHGYGEEDKGDVSVIKIIEEKTVFVDKMFVPSLTSIPSRTDTSHSTVERKLISRPNSKRSSSSRRSSKRQRTFSSLPCSLPLLTRSLLAVRLN